MAVRGPAELRRSPRLPASEKAFRRAMTCTGLSLVGWSWKGRISLCECRGPLRGHPLTTPAWLYRSAGHAGEEGSNAVAGVPVLVVLGHVVQPGGAWVGVAHGNLHVAHRDPTD